MTVKTCFVVQGFGKKTDFQTGRVLDLDASYDVIRSAVQAAGLECKRADEIQHSGTIDQPMYEHILEADLVIADLSTSNLNAVYELGVRHALRRKATIVVAESKFSFPFDVSHVLIRTYEHLGTDIGRREAQRFVDDLKTAIEEILDSETTDSPVYTYLPDLRPPRELEGEALQRRARVSKELTQTTVEGSVKALMDQAAQARKRGDFAAAKTVLTGVRAMKPKDEFVIQQLARATYKSRIPTPMEALEEARRMIEPLQPHQSHDAETLGLWGAIHKGMWEETGKRGYLDEAIATYERGFYMQSSTYNGINLAFLLNARATLSEPADAIADFVLASRIRDRIVQLCDAALSDDVKESQVEQYWIRANLWEAAIGLGNTPEAARWSAEATANAPEPWMLASTVAQIAKLQEFLASSPLHQLGASQPARSPVT